MKTKIVILQNFKYGDIGSPKHMIASNVVQDLPDDVPKGMLKTWITLKWVKVVE
jgi:hypothetical protein